MFPWYLHGSCFTVRIFSRLSCYPARTIVKSNYFLTHPNIHALGWLLPRFVSSIWNLASPDGINYDQGYPYLELPSQRVRSLHKYLLSSPLKLFAFLLKVTLAIRTWAVWGQDRTVGLELVAFVIATLIPQCTFLSR